VTAIADGDLLHGWTSMMCLLIPAACGLSGGKSEALSGGHHRWRRGVVLRLLVSFFLIETSYRRLGVADNQPTGEICLSTTPLPLGARR